MTIKYCALTLVAPMMLNLSCKTRCIEGSACSFVKTEEVTETNEIRHLPWSEDMTSEELLNNSNEIYGELARRYQSAGRAEFLVPEFAPINDKISEYWKKILDSLQDTSKPDEKWRLRTISKSLDTARQELIDQVEDETLTQTLLYLLEVDYHYQAGEVSEFNESLSFECMSQRYDQWKKIAYTDSKITYSGFWKGFEFFAFSISSSCSKPDKKSETASDYAFHHACVASGFCLPVFLKESKFSDFNSLVHVPLALVGTIDRAMIIDNVAMLPHRFVLHDFAHAQDINRTLSREHIETFFPEVPYVSYAEPGTREGITPASVEKSQLDDILKTLERKRRQNACVLDGIAQSESRSSLETLYFFYTHEEPARLEDIPKKKPSLFLPKLVSEQVDTRFERLWKRLNAVLIGNKTSSWQKPLNTLKNIITECLTKP